MHELIDWLTYLLSIAGLTILIVWPPRGPSALIRDRLLRRLLPFAVHEVLDCYLCCSFWSGLLLSPPWWFVDHAIWCWSGCLIAPALFWLALGNPVTDEPSNQTTSTEPDNDTTEKDPRST
jgi:hypothetical protein